MCVCLGIDERVLRPGGQWSGDGVRENGGKLWEGGTEEGSGDDLWGEGGGKERE